MTLSDWMRHVLAAEGLNDWTIRLAADGYCWTQTKVIQIPANASCSLFLHEVAHALYQEPEGPMQNHYHGGEWSATYGALVDKYMMRRNNNGREHN